MRFKFLTSSRVKDLINKQKDVRVYFDRCFFSKKKTHSTHFLECWRDFFFLDPQKHMRVPFS